MKNYIVRNDIVFTATRVSKKMVKDYIERSIFVPMHDPNPKLVLCVADIILIGIVRSVAPGMDKDDDIRLIAMMGDINDHVCCNYHCLQKYKWFRINLVNFQWEFISHPTVATDITSDDPRLLQEINVEEWLDCYRRINVIKPLVS